MAKGQFFIIAAIIIVIALVGFKGFVAAYSSVETHQLGRSDISEKLLENLMKEYKHIMYSSAKTTDEEQTKSRLFSFSDFVADEEKKIFYVFLHRNDRFDEYKVTFGNFLGKELDIMLYSFGSSPEYFQTNCSHRNQTTKRFSVSQGSVNITLMYKTDSDTDYSTEELSFDVDRNTTIGFFDIIIDKDNYLEIKDVYISSIKILTEKPEQISPEQGCGNGICEPPEENILTCPEDCTPICGNGICEPGEEITCPQDCPQPVCGNGICEKGENMYNCFDDCGWGICGNGYCEAWAGENLGNCPEDCGPVCGNHICEVGENSDNCPADCGGLVCGNGICEAPRENRYTCPIDCGYAPV